METSLIVEVTIKGKVQSYDLSQMQLKLAGRIHIGRDCQEVWNAIALPSDQVDPFQCTLLFENGMWIVKPGQRRIVCFKGLRSNRPIPCNFCMGRCVNARPAHPDYAWRIPEQATFLNGKVINQDGQVVTNGDILTLGDFNLQFKKL